MALPRLKALRLLNANGYNGSKGSAAITAVADLLAIPRNSPQIYQYALTKVLDILDLVYGNLRILNSSSGELDLMTDIGFPPDYRIKFKTIKIGERCAGKVVRKGGPVYWDNIQTDPACAYLCLRKQGVNSMVGVPLMAQEGVIGTLTVASTKRGWFQEHEIQFLTAMGRVLGSTIEHSRLVIALKNNVDDLTKLTLRLEESDGIKNRLLSVISPELRTPISIILGNVDLLMEGTFGDLNDKQKNSLLTVRRGGVGLLFHVENALDVSQLEAGGVSVYPGSFTIDHVKNEVMEVLGDEVKRKQLELLWEIDSNMPELITDQGKIVKVFRNIIDNAIKFTEKGSVRVKVSYLEDRKGIQGEIEDTGVGIPEAQFRVIFDPFHQMDSSHTRLYGGMGLGLRAVKKSLELLGGGIEVESTVRQGSLFRFWFPAQVERRN